MIERVLDRRVAGRLEAHGTDVRAHRLAMLRVIVLRSHRCGRRQCHTQARRNAPSLHVRLLDSRGYHHNRMTTAMLTTGDTRLVSSRNSSGRTIPRPVSRTPKDPLSENNTLTPAPAAYTRLVSTSVLSSCNRRACPASTVTNGENRPPSENSQRTPPVNTNSCNLSDAVCDGAFSLSFAASMRSCRLPKLPAPNTSR